MQLKQRSQSTFLLLSLFIGLCGHHRVQATTYNPDPKKGFSHYLDVSDDVELVDTSEAPSKSIILGKLEVSSPPIGGSNVYAKIFRPWINGNYKEGSPFDLKILLGFRAKGKIKRPFFLTSNCVHIWKHGAPKVTMEHVKKRLSSQLNEILTLKIAPEFLFLYTKEGKRIKDMKKTLKDVFPDYDPSSCSGLALKYKIHYYETLFKNCKPSPSSHSDEQKDDSEDDLEDIYGDGRESEEN